MMLNEIILGGLFSKDCTPYIVWGIHQWVRAYSQPVILLGLSCFTTPAYEHPECTLIQINFMAILCRREA
jgi:hypothetical protein